MENETIRSEKIKAKSAKVVAIITAISAIAVAIISVVIQKSCNIKGSDKPAINQKTDSGSNYNAGGDIIIPGQNSTVINAKDSSQITVNLNSGKGDKKTAEIVRQPIIDQSVKSYNAQPGSITARNVEITIPEEQESPNNIYVPDNFIVDTFTAKEYFVFKVRPKIGSWDSTFIAFPEDEKAAVDATFSNQKYVVYGKVDGDMTGLKNGRQVRYAFFLCWGESATPKNAFMIQCKSRPSIVWFGSYSDRNKQYTFPISENASWR